MTGVSPFFSKGPDYMLNSADHVPVPTVQLCHGTENAAIDNLYMKNHGVPIKVFIKNGMGWIELPGYNLATFALPHPGCL